MDRLESGRIKLARVARRAGSEAAAGDGLRHRCLVRHSSIALLTSSPQIAPLARFVPGWPARRFVAAIEGDTIQLSADASSAELFEEEADGTTRH